MPGMTAYAGLLDDRPAASPARPWWSRPPPGAVGSVVGQIAKIKGCRAVGIAGGREKCRYVTRRARLRRLPRPPRSRTSPSACKAACPKGIDVYFENVGGAVFDAVLPLLNNFARIPVCGLIAHYNATELPAGPGPRCPADAARSWSSGCTFRGFIVWDFAALEPDFRRDVAGWLREGRVKYREDVTDGLENAPAALIGLLEGRNFGKQLVRVGPGPGR